ncbi:hypothetical protein QR685DRAFT_595314 [Neurospora intermedia]|uniref:Uncharacterized protein n=1 Tax=Neurospora intermedia TaxID=5142 RepID=A0ABR3DMT0_NEUIN
MQSSPSLFLSPRCIIHPWYVVYVLLGVGHHRTGIHGGVWGVGLPVLSPLLSRSLTIISRSQGLRSAEKPHRIYGPIISGNSFEKLAAGDGGDSTDAVLPGWPHVRMLWTPRMVSGFGSDA